MSALLQCHDYEQYLAAVGTGPLSRVMVMRASVVVGITQVGRVIMRARVTKVEMKEFIVYLRSWTRGGGLSLRLPSKPSQ